MNNINQGFDPRQDLSIEKVIEVFNKFPIRNRVVTDLVSSVEYKEQHLAYSDQQARVLCAYLFGKTQPKQTIEVEVKLPTLLEWLSTKAKTFKVKVEVDMQDILVNPPKTNQDTIRMYTLVQKT